MSLQRAAATLTFLCLINGPSLAQAVPPATATRQPSPTAAPNPTATVDLEATRKRFDANAAKTVDNDRRRDLKLKQSMSSICAGCDSAAPGKRTRVSRPSRPDEADPAD